MPKSRNGTLEADRQIRFDDSVLDPDSEIRRLLKNRKLSNFAKYKWLTVGCDSWRALFHYELLMSLFGGMRGALGLYGRQTLYPRLFRSCGRGVVIGRNVTIRHPRRIEIGNHVVIDDNVVLDGKGDADCTIQIGDDSIIGRNSILVCKGGRIELGTEVNISVNCTMISESRLQIGGQTLIAGHCYIIAGGNHGTNCSGVPFVSQPRIDKGGTHIKSNCWIGAHATILDGIDIGPNAIVAAASLVNHSVPPRSVVGGVPARPITLDQSDGPHADLRRRFDAFAS